MQQRNRRRDGGCKVATAAVVYGKRLSGEVYIEKGRRVNPFMGSAVGAQQGRETVRNAPSLVDALLR